MSEGGALACGFCVGLQIGLILAVVLTGDDTLSQMLVGWSVLMLIGLVVKA